MKAIKLFTLMLVALMGLTACSSGDDNRTVTNTYSGYVFASFQYVPNGYYGTGTLTVKVDNGVYSVSLKNEQWGEATFEKVTVGETISGTGTITMDYQGEPHLYEDVTLSGTFDDMTITAPTLMRGGTTLKFYMGTFPADKMAGTFSGTNSVKVGEFGPYEAADLEYEITANEDGTINLTLPAYQLEGVEVMGDLSLGSHTISNIAYNPEDAAFERAYGYDELEQEVMAVKDGQTTLSGLKKFNQRSYISIRPVLADQRAGKLGVKVENKFSYGEMPFMIESTFEGK